MLKQVQHDESGWVTSHNIAAIRGGQTITQKRTDRLLAIFTETGLSGNDNIAVIRTLLHIPAMFRRVTSLSLLCVALSGCSYLYDVLAVVRDGRLHFIVDPDSRREPSCLRRIEVVARDGAKAKPESGDDIGRVEYGTYWFESVDYRDDCANKFPQPYARTLKGKHQADFGLVAPKPLLRDVVYDVSITTGPNGYGSGRFVILADGRVRNLDPHEATPQKPAEL